MWFYRVRQNYGNQGLMERYKFNSLSAISITRELNLFINMLMNRLKKFRVKISYLTREMTIDRNTIVTLHKKGHSNSSIANILRETVFKVVRKFN